MANLFSRLPLIGKKVLMTQLFDNKTGLVTPVTILKVESSAILGIVDRGMKLTVKVGSIITKKNNVNNAQRQEYLKKNLECRKMIKTFHLNKTQSLPVKTLNVEHYNIGQYIDITAFSKGKGFAGGMKRHNFSGLEASHGVSVKHRSIGSTGQCQDPGRVFKGKKMPGQLGNKKVTVQNIRILDIDKKRNLIIVNGSVPGSKNSVIIMKDAIKKPLLI